MPGSRGRKAARGLTARQAAFTREYQRLGDAKAAAEAAGYTGTDASLRTTGSRLLKMPAVRDAISSGIERATAQAEVSAADVVRELARVALSDVGAAFDVNGDLLPVGQLPEELRRAVAGVDVEERYTDDGRLIRTKKLKLWPKVEALGLLARKFALLVDKTQHELGPGLAELISASMSSMPSKGGGK